MEARNSVVLDDVLLALRCGRLSPAVFERRTRGIWTAMAESLLRRWRGPVAVSVDDVRQELLINAWIFCGHWDPKLGVPISRFIIYNANDKAKKWLHQQRNAYRRDDKAPSRFDRTVSSLGLPDYAEEHLFDSVASQPSQEQALIDRERLRNAALIAASRLPSEHRPAMVALAETGDSELAARALKESLPACVALRLESLDDARHAVSRALQFATA